MEEYSIKQLFCSKDKFVIPEYQRAYSWEKTQREQFLEDLRDAENSYYLGHYLLEKRNEDCDTYYVIDGQQRMTTIVIFMSCMVHELTKRPALQDKINKLKRTFLYNLDENQRFHTQSYDDAFFYDEVIVRSTEKESDDTLLNTSSKRHIRHCRQFFDRELSRASDEALEKWMNLVSNARITYFEVKDKGEAAQIFAFQNDRGKSLTNLEKLKSFFMLQIFLYGGKQQEDYVNRLEISFCDIYQRIAAIRTNEDYVLRYFWMAYSSVGFNTQNTLDEIKMLFKGKGNLSGINDFVSKLAKAFAFVENFERDKETYCNYLRQLNNIAWCMPVLIKASVIANVSPNTIHTLKILLENFTFRAMVRGGRASVESRLNRLLNNATNEESVLQNIRAFIDSMQHDYWNDRQFKEALRNGYIFNRSKACSYLLWRYEETLWVKGYKANLFNIERESIEHIAPQHPREGECLANGYGAYNDTETPVNGIESGEWLSSIGNLMLVSTRHNSSLGNKNFADKVKDYGQSNLLMQQKEIHDKFCNQENPIWDKAEIEKRGKRIIEKAMEIWKLSNIAELCGEPLF